MAAEEQQLRIELAQAREELAPKDLKLEDYEDKLKHHLEKVLTADAQAQLIKSRPRGSPPSERELNQVSYYYSDLHHDPST